MTPPALDVAVVGDGPAGLALAAAARRRRLRVLLAGRGEPWTATYGSWRDDVADLPDTCFASISATAVVHGHRRHELQRAYAVLDNDALREHLARDVDTAVCEVARVRHFAWGSRVMTDSGDIDARIVVDARGRRAHPAATAQSAYGIVVDHPPPGVDDRAPTLMDLRPAGDGPSTFCYAVPVARGWLVEETVLAARPMVPPDSLRSRLATRIGPVDAMRQVEQLVIPLGGRLPSAHDPVPRFGAAAGYIHPATGFSVAASLRAAPRVAAAISTACAATRGGARPDARRVWHAVWPPAMRRTRRLHDFGLEVLLGLDQDALATFFDAFFDLPVPVWAPYLRIDAPPRAVSRTMAAVLRRLPPGMRRRLLVDPRRAVL